MAPFEKNPRDKCRCALSTKDDRILYSCYIKKIGLFRCKIIAWKYTRFNKYNNFLLQYLIQHLVWNGIDKLYMMSETHVQQANKIRDNGP